MTTALLIVAVILAASVCPATTWWNARHGRRGCLPNRAAGSEEAGELEFMRREQAELTARIAELEQEGPAAAR